MASSPDMAAVIASLLMVLNYVLSRRDNMASRPRATAAELLRATGGAVLPLVMPVIMVIGIRFGSLYDATQTRVITNGDTQLVKTVSWYDNEMSYVSQLVRSLHYFAKLISI